MTKNKVQPKVFVITGATGVGKTTITRYLHDHYHMPRVITHTTRPPREKEVDGVSYYFETDASFAQNHYLERVVYAGAQYGSSFEGLERAWEKAPLITIVLDTAGAITYARELGERAVILFVTVNDPQTLIERVTVRGDDPRAIEARVASAEFERDRQLPAELVGKAIVVPNDYWSTTKNTLDRIVGDVMAGRSIVKSES
ncbi:MAG TPA: guanylate kinase [Lactobacillaceae bacterium]|jgi:guanylate kinase